MVTECCSKSRMRSRTSRGVPEWSGGKDLYMGSPVLATGRVSGVTGNVPGPPEGSGGPPGGSTCPEGPNGLYLVRNQPLSGLMCPLPLAHKAPQRLPWPPKPLWTCWSSPGTPGTIPDSNTLRPIYRSSPPDHSGVPLHVRDLIRDSEQP